MRKLALAIMLLSIIGFTTHAQETAPEPEEAVEAVEEAAEEAPAEEPAAEPEPEPEPETEDEPDAEPPPAEEPESGLGILYAFLSGGGLLGLLQALRKTGFGPHSVPAYARPFIAPAIALLGWGANELFGAPLDFSALEALLAGTVASVAHNGGSSAGFLTSTGEE